MHKNMNMNINNRMMDRTTTVSVHDRFSGRQANNLLAEHLPEAVRPWFDDWSDDAGIESAIEALREPRRRTQAANYLGLDLIPAA